MFKVKILSANKDILQEDNSSFLDVHYEISNEDGEVIADRKRAFDFGTDAESIKTELAKEAEVLESEMILAEENKERDAADLKASSTIDELMSVEE